jgi:cytochrome c
MDYISGKSKEFEIVRCWKMGNQKAGNVILFFTFTKVVNFSGKNKKLKSSEMKLFALYCIIAFSFSFIILSCNSSAPEGSSNGGTVASSSVPEGLTVMKKYDCATCHNATAKIVGPSFKDIAGKYPNSAENIAMLTGKVISGGSGVWGTVPMAAHPTLTQQDAEKIIVYILTVGGK